MKELLKKIKPLHRLYLYLLQKKRKIKDKLTIPAYEIKRKTILGIANKYGCNELFIETGTYMGETVEFVKAFFKKVISIELSEPLAEKAIRRFDGEDNIQILQGDSAHILADILLPVTKPVVFWLDGHYSSEFQVNDEYIITGKGEKNTPIEEEIRQIGNHPVKNHLILIDDARLFNGQGDYPTMAKIKRMVIEYLTGHSVSIKNDMILILPTKNNND